MVKVLSALLLAGLLIAGCATNSATTQTADSKAEKESWWSYEGSFRGRWWSYHERGSKYLATEQFDLAAADFEKALDGRRADSWRARTYGLHFVEYFPNRELGIAYYQMGRLEEAAEYLNRSLEQVDTERAHYYIDKVTKDKIAKGEISDTVDPTLAASFAMASLARAVAPVGLGAPGEEPAPRPETTPIASGSIISERSIDFNIQAKDDVGVAEVKVNGEQLYQRGAQEDKTFTEELVLEEGTHELQVAAKDLADKETTETITVTVDITGPNIGVFSPIEPTITQEGTVILEGATVDKHGVVSVTVGESILAQSAGEPRLPFDTEMPLGDGENVFVLAARDIAGNETRAAVKVFRGDPESLEAKLWLLEQKNQQQFQLASATSDAAVIEMILSATLEEGGGEIRLKSPDEGRPYHNSRTMRISGEVVTQTKVTELTINGQPFDELTGAPKESFNKRIPIAQDAISEDGGRMQVAIAAKDEAGNEYNSTFDVEIQPVDLNTKESKMPVAILAFAPQGVENAAAESLRVETETQIFNYKHERFRVLDRTRLQEVLTEQELASALADPNEAIRLGKITNAQVFLIADVFARDQNGLEIKARAVSTETTDVIATLDAFIDDSSDRAKISAACSGLAAQLDAVFPRLSGQILSVKGTQILLDWSEDDGIKEGAYVILVGQEEPWIDEDTGEILEPGEFYEVGRARIVRVRGGSAQAETIELKEEGVELEKGMPAITM